MFPYSRHRYGYVKIVNFIQAGLSDDKYCANDVENAPGCAFYDNEQIYTPSLVLKGD